MKKGPPKRSCHDEKSKVEARRITHQRVTITDLKGSLDQSLSKNERIPNYNLKSAKAYYQIPITLKQSIPTKECTRKLINPEDNLSPQPFDPL
jgi:hypothetical protein